MGLKKVDSFPGFPHMNAVLPETEACLTLSWIKPVHTEFGFPSPKLSLQKYGIG